MTPLPLAEAASTRLGWPLHVVDDAAHVPHIEQPDALRRSARSGAQSGIDRQDGHRGGGSMNYGLAYAIGFHPWEDLAEHPPFADKLMELIACEEDEYGPPYGPALDLEPAARYGACNLRSAAGR